MSYEGYTQNICKAGHLFNDASEGCAVCPYCKREAAWTNQVDDTNCDSVGYIPESEFDKVKVVPACIQKCNLGHMHVVSEAIYRIPKKNELQRYYRDEDTREWVKIDL